MRFILNPPSFLPFFLPLFLPSSSKFRPSFSENNTSRNKYRREQIFFDSEKCIECSRSPLGGETVAKGADKVLNFCGPP